jgi:predicted nucleic acid-binding protein
LTNRRDENHQRALEIGRSLGTTVLATTDEVLAEFLTFFSWDPQLRTEAALLVRDLLVSKAVRVFPQTRTSFLCGLQLYIERPDKGYSLTDCISMATMRREGIAEVLTNDRHFEQDGFRALFR